MMLSWGYCGVLPLTLLEYSNEFDIVEKPLPMNGCKAQTLPTKLQNGIEILTWFADFYLVDVSSAYLRLITKGKQIVAATQGPLQLTGRSASIIRDGGSSLASLAIKTMWGKAVWSAWGKRREKEWVLPSISSIFEAFKLVSKLPSLWHSNVIPHVPTIAEQSLHCTLHSCLIPWLLCHSSFHTLPSLLGKVRCSRRNLCVFHTCPVVSTVRLWFSNRLYWTRPQLSPQSLQLYPHIHFSVPLYPPSSFIWF